MTVRLPGWAKTVLSRRERIEEALDLPLGQPLGCGHFGCVFDSTAPWVVKLTRDPTEGAIWQKLRLWAMETSYGTDGIARVKDIVRLRPDLKFGRREWPIHAIVREAALPLYDGYSYSAETIARLGERSSPAYQGNLRELHQLEAALGRFKVLAQEWHKLKARKRQLPFALGRVEEDLSNATNGMYGLYGGSIGETLGQLLADGIVLRDVHRGNIGWRVHERIDDEEANPSLIIFDPGHTPTEASDIREFTPNR
jgi:hypothetical protein